jgi:hypothetical protein
MRFRLMAFVLVMMAAVCGHAVAQSQTGMIFGKVTDATGAIIPGVTVTRAQFAAAAYRANE